MKKKPERTSQRESGADVGRLWLPGLLAFGWCVVVMAASTRTYFLVKYGVAERVDPFLEPFAASGAVTLICLVVAAAWVGLHWKSVQSEKREPTGGFTDRQISSCYLAIGLLPLVVWGLRGSGVVAWPAQFWEVLWIAGWTGQSFGVLIRGVGWNEIADLRFGRWLWLALVLLVFLCGGWWFAQSLEYHRNFMLGFNDFAHFLQRVANTASGRGVLIESPVLPMFWDHFNPGLLLIVPLWSLWPDAGLAFALQAGALAVSALLIFGIARRVGCSRLSAALFGSAWLMQPAIGQMNLAYTYGWHPITLAIPLLLGAIWALLSGRKIVAAASVLLAMSMEEGVFVIVALVAACCALLPVVDGFLRSRKLKTTQESLEGDVAESSSKIIEALPTAVWFAVACFSITGFVLVYKFSGLAEFQTGRFVALGSSVSEILLSPVLRPQVFWGQVLKWDNVLFVALLWLPCGLPALLKGWRYLLPTLLLLAVLIVWDHQPAHSLAFQYPSTLQPLFWLACISGAVTAAKHVRRSHELSSAVAAVMTGFVLSLFVGQFPFSSPTLREVEATTYGVGLDLRRQSADEDGRWLLEQLAEIRRAEPACLATGRIASHLVGCRDVETVGQYLERRTKLAELADRAGDPIRHYDWLILDRLETFQQSTEQVETVEAEALSRGFEVIRERYGIVMLQRR